MFLRLEVWGVIRGEEVALSLSSRYKHSFHPHLVVSHWQGSGTVLVPERNIEQASAFRLRK